MELVLDILEERKKYEKILKKLQKFNTNLCLSCMRCTSGCTTMLLLEHKPHKIVHMIRTGYAPELIDHAWNCALCMKCIDRCPQDVAPAEIFIALRNLGSKEGKMPEWFSQALMRLLESGITEEERKIVKEGKTISRETLGLEPIAAPPEEFLESLMEILEEIIQ